MIFQWKYQVQKIGVDGMSLFTVISLFITSFLPLWISIIFIDVKSLICNGSNMYTEIVSIIVILIANVFSIISLCNWIKREPVTSEELKISYACENKTVSSEYLLAYILPLFAFDFTQWDSVVLFLIFFMTLGYICVKHNNFSVNIILEMLKYNVYDCKIKTEESDDLEIERKIISKTNLSKYKGRIVKIENLNNEYSIIRDRIIDEAE